MTKDEELQVLREENRLLKALVAVYLYQGQLLPTARTCEALAALCGCHLSEATLVQWCELAAERLAPTVERIAELITASPLQYGDGKKHEE